MTAQPLPDARRSLRSVPGMRSGPEDLGREALLQRARDIFRLRRSRVQRFGRAMFGEPAWDMLLAVYIGERQGSSPTIAQLTGFTDAPPKVALRWLDHLIGENLVMLDGPRDVPERTSLGLTLSARDDLEAYLSETLAERDSIG